MQTHQWSLEQAIKALDARLCSAEELTQATLQRIQKYNPGLRAFLAVSEHAMAAARRADERRAAADGAGVPLLTGVPVAIKDLLDTADLPTTYGGRHFQGHTPSRSASVVRRLEEAGAIIIGKTNLHEYAFGTTTENPHYGNTVNPWNRSKIAGGSSGGSSAALVAGLCFAAIGTDTGGSIRIPAALTGHVGFKPTYGLVSKTGVFPLAASLDHVGPMTRTVADAAILLNLLAGYDPEDSGAVQQPVRDYTRRLQATPLRIGVPRSFFFDKCHVNVLQVVQQALLDLERSGHQLIEVDVPLIDEVPDAQTVVINSEAFAVHATQFRNNPAAYGEDVRRRLEGAAEVRGHQYVKAMAFRKTFRLGLDRLFQQIDVLATPTTPLVATDVGQLKAHIRAQEVNVRAHLTRYTNPWNLSGLPALSIPCGLSQDGLPVGLQLVGPWFGDAKLLDVGRRLEERIGWNAVAPDYRNE